MHPVLLEIGGFTITTYGVVVATAALVGTYVLGRGLEARGLDRDLAWTLLGYVFVGAFVGAKLYFVALHGDPGALGQAEQAGRGSRTLARRAARSGRRAS